MYTEHIHCHIIQYIHSKHTCVQSCPSIFQTYRFTAKILLEIKKMFHFLRLKNANPAFWEQFQQKDDDKKRHNDPILEKLLRLIMPSCKFKIRVI
jgi:hypothetical protein